MLEMLQTIKRGYHEKVVDLGNLRWVAAGESSGGGSGLLNVRLLGSCFPTWGDINSMAIQGTNAYFATDAGVHVLDISIPAKPLDAGYCATPEQANAIVISDNYAYVSVWNEGPYLFTIDISNPTRPRVVGSITVM